MAPGKPGGGALCAPPASRNRVKENDTFIVNNLPTCDCSSSTFKDPVHNHIVTGDLRIINNNKLRKLLSKGPNFRENKFINYDRCLTSVETALDTLIENLIAKYNLTEESFQPWKNEITSNFGRFHNL